MATLSAITLTRSDAVTNDVFSPRGRTANEITLVNDRGGISQANPLLVLNFNGSKRGRKTDHVNFRFNLPLSRAVGDPSFLNFEVKDTAIAKVEVVLPISMTATERADLGAQLSDLVSDAICQAYISDLDPML